MSSRALGGVLLVLLGGVVLRVTVTGEFLDYVRAGLRVPLLAVGVVLVVVGVVAVGRGWGRPSEEAPVASARMHTHGPAAVSRAEIAEARRGEGHDHSRTPGVAWLLLAPVLLVLLAPPPALGAFAAARGDGAIPEPPSETRFAPLAGGPAVPLAVHDYAWRAAWDDGRTLAGRDVVLTGFVTPAPDGGWSVTRTVMTCCAADARSYPVQVVGDPRPRVPNTWVQVTGHFVPASAEHHAAVVATAVAPVAAPAQPYE
ncbi:putative repeat protein (TIGR03943 family) [Actinomycetospora succinea]|uniref:Putative repeat protein (TIGR03943 family) n=1 Tax=Actinomycetospora succinea TaxID=663603 RepID=A0A4R6VM66_9PSEU|nr:TIGR03943 family protein [Actinomycetospora succinea]TDQ64882.1 putative repeat protein (TIGR03943 family) [Actinomycetospora succinea]